VVGDACEEARVEIGKPVDGRLVITRATRGKARRWRVKEDVMRKSLFEKLRAVKDTREAARLYIEAGFAVLPVPRREKAPVISGWPTLRLVSDDVENYFQPKDNIAVLNGEPSGNRPEIDLDSDAARRLASALPPTGLVWGHGSAPRSHFSYSVDPPPSPSSKKFVDPTNGETVLEIRSTGGITIVPPSIHPTGERYKFASCGKPASIAGPELVEKVTFIAAAALVAAHWPSTGSRNDAALALSGALLRAGMDVTATEEFMALVTVAADDEEGASRVSTVGDTAGKIEAGQPTTGATRFDEVVADGAKILSTVSGWLKLHASATGHRLFALAEGIRLFHTADHEAFAEVKRERKVEALVIRGSDSPFAKSLAHRYYLAFGVPPKPTELAGVLQVFEARALFDGDERALFTRVAHRGAATYLDLADEKRLVIRITAKGWKLVTTNRISFLRRRGHVALPLPTRGGSLDELRDLLGISDDRDWRLIASWLVFALNPKGPYPLLEFSGEQGTAKSTITRLIKNVLDPTRPPTRSTPRDERDLAIAARSNWILAFDNLSDLRPWLSDALCRMATGAGLATRLLYSDDDEKLFDARRPVILNGIEAPVSRGDLLDRTIKVALPVISASERKTEQQIERAFARIHSRVLGAVLDAAVAVRRELPRLHIHEMPRMADFFRWGVALERVLGWPTDSFAEAYASNIKSSTATLIESSPVGTSLVKYIFRCRTFRGTATSLLAMLQREAGYVTGAPPFGWPKTGRGMVGSLTRIAPALRAKGIGITTGIRSGKGGDRLIELKVK
jgi:Bifunctional DNA primase/polymerase, N-terminal